MKKDKSVVCARNQVEAHMAGGMGEEWHNEAGEGGRGQITKGLISYKRSLNLILRAVRATEGRRVIMSDKSFLSTY